MASTGDRAKERRILRFLNAATAEQITRAVTDDPNFGIGTPQAYGIRRTLAARIVAVRNALAGGRFTRFAQVDEIFGMGPDTVHDVFAALLTFPVEIPAEVTRRLRAATSVVVITGAGVSDPSNLHAIDPAELAAMWTPRGFAQDVQVVWDFHIARRDDARGAEPNESHTVIDAMARWVVQKPDSRGFTLVTQNQDRLHHRAAGTWGRSGEPVAGDYPIIELHGHLFQGRCTACGAIFELPDSLNYDATNPHTLPEDQTKRRYFVCSECGAMARPTVQWLSEPYPRKTLDRAGAAVMAADVVLFVGTSGRVPSVRWLLHEAHWHADAYTIVIDREPEAWVERDGTPDWPGHPIVNATIKGDIVDAMVSLEDAVWPEFEQPRRRRHQESKPAS